MKKISIILPAYNEAQTIGEVIHDFHGALPESSLWVINNGSTDDTEQIALETLSHLGCKGGVIREDRLGKGNAIRRAFMDIDADIYVLADADLTYPADQVHEIIEPILKGKADIVVGDRHSGGHYKAQNKRYLHDFGNRLVRHLVNKLFRAQLKDIMSGYRALSSAFVKNYPILVEGFQIETDMTLHALDKRFRILEIPINYQDRPFGSLSKLNTWYDGFQVLVAIMNIFRHYRPLLFFWGLALSIGLLGLLAGIPAIVDWLREGYVYHIPLAILATGLEIIAIILVAIGLVLDSIAQKNKRSFELRLLDWREGRKIMT